ncbi:hypothetical protein RHGRI_036850 [Rhododendron griersonianum]|uniref:Uncharacterized protein n=1 Tax=Rhododendron griersonianum TaxID=479676 RepID=A0AAV6HQC8_9ERIC|nr:hypothetical protein RHGRI_036850 [Rhododendron griersonianum]
MNCSFLKKNSSQKKLFADFHTVIYTAASLREREREREIFCFTCKFSFSAF